MLAITPCPCDDDYVHLSIVCAGVVSSKTPVGVPGTDVVSAENAEVVDGFKTKIDGIREVLARDNMKVVFFGR